MVECRNVATHCGQSRALSVDSAAFIPINFATLMTYNYRVGSRVAVCRT